MRGRADVDETLQPAELPGRLLNELYTHALESWPEECCGLIFGDAIDRYQRLVRIRNEMTQRHQKDPVAYPLQHGRFHVMQSRSLHIQT